MSIHQADIDEAINSGDQGSPGISTANSSRPNSQSSSTSSGQGTADQSASQDGHESTESIFKRIFDNWEAWNPTTIEKASKEQLQQHYAALKNTLGGELVVPSYAGFGLTEDVVLENQCRDINAFIHRYDIGQNGNFINKSTGAQYRVTPDRISYEGEKGKFGPQNARDMIHDFARRDRSMVKDGEKIQLDNCSRGERAFLLLAIDEYNLSAPAEQQLETDAKMPKWGAKKFEKEWATLSPIPALAMESDFIQATPDKPEEPAPTPDDSETPENPFFEDDLGAGIADAPGTAQQRRQQKQKEQGNTAETETEPENENSEKTWSDPSLEEKEKILNAFADKLGQQVIQQNKTAEQQEQTAREQQTTTTDQEELGKRLNVVQQQQDLRDEQQDANATAQAQIQSRLNEIAQEQADERTNLDGERKNWADIKNSFNTRTPPPKNSKLNFSAEEIENAEDFEYISDSTDLVPIETSQISKAIALTQKLGGISELISRGTDKLRSLGKIVSEKFNKGNNSSDGIVEMSAEEFDKIAAETNPKLLPKLT